MKVFRHLQSVLLLVSVLNHTFGILFWIIILNRQFPSSMTDHKPMNIPQ